MFMEDILYMKEAFKEARIAYDLNEVPIGCVIVHHDNGLGKIIGRGHNLRATQKNALFHAELVAIDQACTYLNDWRLENCHLYVTIEPCPMCAGAILQARIPVVTYGAKNPKAGCAGSILNLLDHSGFNHRTQVISGVLEDECASLMRDFFLRFRN